MTGGRDGMLPIIPAGGRKRLEDHVFAVISGSEPVGGQPGLHKIMSVKTVNG